MAANTACKFATFRGQRDDKHVPIRFSDLTRNQVPFRWLIENAGQCRPLEKIVRLMSEGFSRRDSRGVTRWN